MIPNQWYAILESNEVKNGKPVGFTRLGQKLVAWRDRRGHLAVLFLLPIVIEFNRHPRHPSGPGKNPERPGSWDL